MLITYADTPSVKKTLDHVAERWQEARWPLLLVLIDRKESKTLHVGKEFNSILAAIFDGEGRRHDLRQVPAQPWKVESSRWELEMLWQEPRSISDLAKARIGIEEATYC